MLQVKDLRLAVHHDVERDTKTCGGTVQTTRVDVTSPIIATPTATIIHYRNPITSPLAVVGGPDSGCCGILTFILTTSGNARSAGGTIVQVRNSVFSSMSVSIWVPRDILFLCVEMKKMVTPKECCRLCSQNRCLWACKTRAKYHDEPRCLISRDTN
eukprot:scaffold1912_cov167-Amphora_coffeaeformis.AAC.25